MVRRYVARHHRARLISKLARFSEMFLLAYWNRSNFNLSENGEQHLLEVLSEQFPDAGSIVFDTGANHGEYALMAVKVWHGAVLHAFEILPKIAEKRITRKWEKSGQIIWNDFGLSSQARKVEVKYLPAEDSGSGITSLHEKSAVPATGTIDTGDHYLEANGIQRIDFLKIDVEGHELEVLKGFARALEAGAISAIQFEYGITSGPARCYLGDFYELLEPLGYRIGRLFPDGVAFSDYYPALDEGHIMGNYVAVRQNLTDLINRLAITKDSIFLPD